MKFNYYSLQENLLGKIVLNNETIYILDSFSDKNILEKQYEKEIFSKNPLFLIDHQNNNILWQRENLY